MGNNPSSFKDCGDDWPCGKRSLGSTPWSSSGSSTKWKGQTGIASPRRRNGVRLPAGSHNGILIWCVIKMNSETTHGMIKIQATDASLWQRRSPMLGVSMTCMAMSGSGVRMGTMIILWYGEGPERNIHRTAPCVAWRFMARQCGIPRSAFRGEDYPVVRSSDIGFRLVRSF